MERLELRLRISGGEIASSTPGFDLDFSAGRLAPAGWAARARLRDPRRRARRVLTLSPAPAARSSDVPDPFRPSSAWTLPDVQAQRIDFGEHVGRRGRAARGLQLLDLGDQPGHDLRPQQARLGGLRRSRRPPARALAGARRDLRRFHRRTATAARSSASRSTAGPVSSWTGPSTSSCSGTSTGSSRQGDLSRRTVLLWNHGDLLLRLEGDLTRRRRSSWPSRSSSGNRAASTGVLGCHSISKSG